MSNNDGFTLIELMFVLAIIGALAAIGFPNFISFRDNAFKCEALELAKPLQDDIVEYYGFTGSYPMTNSDLGLSDTELIQGKQVSSMSIAQGVIEIRFQEDSRIANRIIFLQPAIIGDPMSGNIIWQYVERAVE